MDKKSFWLVLTIVIVTVAISAMIKFYRPASNAQINFDAFPLSRGDWTGVREEVPDYVIEMLNPKEILAATYTNGRGARVQVLFDFFSGEASFGGPHSPRNCLPGAGWSLSPASLHPIALSDRTITVDRIVIGRDNTKQVMDFWYVTNYGETSSDYRLKLYSMLSSLTLKPRDVAFIRLIADDNEESRAALDEFESLFVDEIYNCLPF